MKRTIAFLVFTTIILACKKDQAVIYNTGLSGKWELTEYYNGIGIAGGWFTADDNTRHTIEFKSNGDFVSTAQLYYGANAYEIADTLSIKFLNTTQVNGELQYNYKLEDNNSILTISPVCYEGCAYKYKAIK